MQEQHRTPPLEVVQWLQEEIERSARLTPEDLKRARMRSRQARQDEPSRMGVPPAPQQEP